MAKNKYDYDLPDHKIQHGVEVDLETLLVEPQAQRELDERRAQGISNSLIPSAIGSLTVSQRDDGKRYIIDGMHRRRAAQLSGWQTMPAEIHYGLSVEQEAILFLIKNKESKAPNPLAEFKVGVTAGVPIYRDIANVLAEHDLVVGTNSTNQVSAVRAMEFVTRRWGPSALDTAISVAEKAWGRTADTWNGSLLGGIGEFVGTHTDLDVDRLVKVIQKKGSPAAWIGLAHGMQQHGSSENLRRGVYKTLVETYNKGLGPTSKQRIKLG